MGGEHSSKAIHVLPEQSPELLVDLVQFLGIGDRDSPGAEHPDAIFQATGDNVIRNQAAENALGGFFFFLHHPLNPGQVREF